MAEGLGSKLSQALFPSSRRLAQDIRKTVAQERITPERLEEILLLADLGPQAAKDLTAELFRKNILQRAKSLQAVQIRTLLARKLDALLTPLSRPLSVPLLAQGVFTVLVVGVNGGGKTSTVGKLAWRWRQEGKKVLLAAVDTFRAAAIEQLQIWGERVDCPVFSRPRGSDPVSVAYQALQFARRHAFDALLLDSAGRMHNRHAFMAELAKMRRALSKQDPAAPHETLLVMDAAIGRNALMQTEVFRKEAGVSGLVLTKMDGAAKGGVLVALAQRFAIPICAIGVGEEIRDLHPFNSGMFARSLLDVLAHEEEA